MGCIGFTTSTETVRKLWWLSMDPPIPRPKTRSMLMPRYSAGMPSSEKTWSHSRFLVGPWPTFLGMDPRGIPMEDLRRPLWPKMVELLMADDGMKKLAKIPMKNAVSCSHIFQYIPIPISLIWLMGPKETPCATLPWGLVPTSPVLRLFLWPQRHRQFCISQKSCVHLHKTSTSKGTNWNTLTVSFHKFTRIEWKCRRKCLDLRAFQASHGNLCPSAAFHPPTFLSRQRMDTPNRWQSRVQLAEINPPGLYPAILSANILYLIYIYI